VPSQPETRDIAATGRHLMATTHHPLGIDIGGSGIKGAPVDLTLGQFAKDRMRLDTPKVSSPDAVADLVVQIAEHFADDTGDSPIGVTLPAVVTNGVVRTAANIDSAWIGTDARKLLSDRLGRPVTVVLSWAQWAERLQRYYSHVEDLLWPDLIVVGGGVSRKAEKFLPLLHLRAPIVAAQLANSAGIVGAAWLASS